ncbi:MAG: hypothetical protein AAF333_15420 [Planctomycetota bacterium]
MPIDFECPSCGRTLRVADKYAGRRGTCPACAKRLDIPEDVPTLELLPEDRSTYEVVIEPVPQPAPPRPRQLDPAGTPSPEHSAGSRGFNEGAIDPRVAQRLREMEREPPPRPWWRRPFLTVFGVDFTPVSLLVVPLLALGLLFWFFTGPGKAAHLGKPRPVFVVEVLDRAEAMDPRQKRAGGNSLANLQSSTSLTGPSGVTRARVYSGGGRDVLMVTQPDGDGDFVLLDVKLKQGILNNLGQTSGYDSVIKADAFELRKTSDAPGTGVAPRLITSRFDRPVDIDLMGAQTTSYESLLPPATTTPPDRLDVEKMAASIMGEAEYALGPTKGTVNFSASRSFNGMPAAKGLTATGRLTMTHPQAPGLRVDADYQGAFLTVDWNRGAQGQWSESRIVESTKASPFDRYEFALLFPRPVDGGKYTLSFAGRDIGTVRLARAKQPSAPTPSPIASNRPGGPQPTSKNSNSPLAYFDVLRDAKGRAEGIVSANNMRQIGFGLQFYLNDHNGRFPESLLDLRPYLPNLDQLMVNPRTGEHPGFIYEKPPPGANPAATPVLFEALGGQKDPTGAMLYGDGGIR